MIRSLSGVTLGLVFAALPFPAFSAPPDPLTLDVRDFGAKGDGVTDDTAAIQAALEAAKRGAGPAPGARSQNHVLLPGGTFLLSAPLRIPSGVRLRGAGPTTILSAAPSFGGEALLVGDNCNGKGDYLRDIEVKDLAFRAEIRIAAFFPRCAAFVTSRLEHIRLFTPYGLKLNTYTQGVVVDGLDAYGPTEQLIHLRGNWNTLANIDKEGDTGSDDSPYILVQRFGNETSHGNHIRGVLLEYRTSGAKSGIVADGATDLTIDDYWFEPQLTNGYALQAIDGSIVALRGTLVLVGDEKSRLRAANRSLLVVERLSLYEFKTLFTKVEVDASSLVRLEELYTGDARGQLPPRPPRNVEVVRLTALDATSGPPLRFVDSHWPPRPDGALGIANEDFEAGRLSWHLGGREPMTEEYLSSELTAGRMAHFRWLGGDEHLLTQEIKVSEAEVGLTLTVSFLARTLGPGTCVEAVADGPGVDGMGSRECEPAPQWKIVSRRVLAQRAGPIAIGVKIKSTNPESAEVYLRQVRVAVGAPTTGRAELEKEGPGGVASPRSR